MDVFLHRIDKLFFPLEGEDTAGQFLARICRNRAAKTGKVLIVEFISYSIERADIKTTVRKRAGAPQHWLCRSSAVVDMGILRRGIRLKICLRHTPHGGAINVTRAAALVLK